MQVLRRPVRQEGWLLGGAPGGGAGSHGRGRAPHGRELCQVLGLPAAAGMSSLSRGFVACCSRFANLSYVAIPLRDKRVTQRKLSDYFAITRVYTGCKNVEVQQQLTKYFTLKPKADRAGAVAPRCRHRRHRRHRHHHHLLHSFNAAVARLTMGCSPLPRAARASCATPRRSCRPPSASRRRSPARSSSERAMRPTLSYFGHALWGEPRGHRYY